MLQIHSPQVVWLSWRHLRPQASWPSASVLSLSARSLKLSSTRRRNLQTESGIGYGSRRVRSQRQVPQRTMRSRMSCPPPKCITKFGPPVDTATELVRMYNIDFSASAKLGVKQFDIIITAQASPLQTTLMPILWSRQQFRAPPCDLHLPGRWERSTC